MKLYKNKKSNIHRQGLSAAIYIKKYILYFKGVLTMNIKTLKENMRRFNTKNLSEQDSPWESGDPDYDVAVKFAKNNVYCCFLLKSLASVTSNIF